ncbi:hypothetical protein AYL99_06572 [Fonsecaea erecta]|uniref:ABM domain-containing protein n=1 Tax=Fonsecaea erecta TaxID=1367422 RepID=A0A178ZHI7_9EURO|nr:hypothetical protein AYL99_06572 [Fonsecaea erecta]OAP59274.1 hypothetical protein AYL99_06572 [Fonsecaea erecta]
MSLEAQSQPQPQPPSETQTEAPGDPQAQPPKQNKQLTLFVDFHIQPDQIEAFKAAHRPVWAACAAEPECLLFDVFHDAQDPAHFRFVEVWAADRAWFEACQLTKPYYAALWERSRPTWRREVVIEYFEREGEGH